MKRALVMFCLALIAVSLGFAENLKEVIAQYHPDMSKGLIYVSKVDMTLTLADSSGSVVKVYPMACGRNIGPKRVKGDLKTPEGVFSLQQIQDASSWGHNFNDGKGYIQHAYGPWFLRLLTPGFGGIGIHGTHAPESIGTRATEGCIRLENSNVADLHDRVTLGMTVIIGHEPEGSVETVVPLPSRQGSQGAQGANVPDSVIHYVRPAWNWPPLDEQRVATPVGEASTSDKQ